MRKVSSISTALIREGTVSLAVLDTTSLVNEAIRRHDLSPLAAAALGRTLTGAAYLCSWLKAKSALSVTVDGGGPGGKICVTGDEKLGMRGYIANPDVYLPPREDGKLDVGGCVGKDGTITVVRDDGTKLPFTGTCPLVSGEIAEDFSAYFLTSEQRPTAVALGVLIGKDGKCAGAGGVFLQPLPGAGEDAVDYCEREISSVSRISSLIAEGGAEGVLRMFTEEEPSVRRISFRCGCSRRRAERAILSLGKEDALDAVREQGVLSVTCHYCNTEYLFYETDILRLFGERK